MSEREDAPARIEVVRHPVVEAGEVDACYEVYEASFGHLRVQAAARHVLTRAEFAEEMADPRIDKYVAVDGDGAMLGMSTLAVDLAAVPWISQEFYAARYPEHTARAAVYYLGFTMVDRRRQRAGVFEAMVDEIVVRLRRERALCAWDMCTVNIDAGLDKGIVGILERSGGADVGVIDQQTYIGADFAAHPGHPR